MSIAVAHSPVAIGNVGGLLEGISMVAHGVSGYKIDSINGSGGVVLCLCELGFSVQMAGQGICILCLAEYWRILGTPSVQPVAPYVYLLPTMYLFMADIANPDLFVCGCRSWICLDITRFLRSSASHPAGPHGRLAQTTINRAPITGGGRF